MHIEELLKTVENDLYFRVPKAMYDSETLYRWFFEQDIQGNEMYWLIACTHKVNHAGSATDAASLLSLTEQKIPPDLDHLLKLTDGAEFYRLHYKGGVAEDYYIPRYQILSYSELVTVNMQLLDTFRSYAEVDPEMSDTSRLNYVAFCEVGDGNYLAISPESKSSSHIFFLDHEYGYYPYSSQLAIDGYLSVANSIEEWLGLLVSTNGWSGLGTKVIPL